MRAKTLRGAVAALAITVAWRQAATSHISFASATEGGQPPGSPRSPTASGSAASPTVPGSASSPTVAGSAASPIAPGSAAASTAPEPEPPPEPAGGRCFDPAAAIALKGRSCAPLAAPQISCYLPPDVEGGLAQPNLNVRQRAADLFAWQEAIALDWPAARGERGVPDRGRRLADAGPRVWETWKEEKEVYLPGGAPPAAWNAPSPIVLPAACGGVEKLLFRKQKIDDDVDSVVQAVAADGTLPATLTDQKKKLVRYEIRLNRTLFEAIVANRFYDGRHQAEAAVVDFPAGAILVKASWREVTREEEPLFETADACVCDELAAGRAAACHVARVGLVGLHIMHKTPSAPQWIWSTFEQVNNVASGGGAAPSFFDPTCNPLRCPVNRQTPPGTPNQLARSTPIPSVEPRCGEPNAAMDNVRQLNDDVAAALGASSSALRNYRLVGTQWPLAPAAAAGGAAPGGPEASRAGTGTIAGIGGIGGIGGMGATAPAGAPPVTVFSVRPQLLANTTMESFVQGTSSCMGCHSTARTTNADRFVAADFSFTLNNALPKVAASRVLAPPKEPKTAWDRAHWQEVERGRALAVDTYRLLPGAVGAKLHCASCHLAAGGDPDAAWWVGMRRAYPTETALADRINQCFEHSLNGKEICAATPAKGKVGCAEAPDMKALIAYMDWLTEQWRASHGGEPVRGYPALSAHAGDAARGGVLYLQKCAVCHDAGGQGRYEHATYFRPALWGAASFNACAGMAKAATLAAFAHGNMPLGAGGALAPQEAWDVAAYIDSQCRPGLGKDAQGRTCPASAYCEEGRPTPGAVPSLKPWLIDPPPP